MSFTLDKCPLSQSASPCMPHQRGKTEHTGFSAWLKALVWICRTVLQQRERRCQSLSEVTSLKVNPKCFAAIFSAKLCLSYFRLHQADGQCRHSKHHVICAHWNRLDVLKYVVCLFSFCITFVYLSTPSHFHTVLCHYSLLFAGAGGPISWSVYIAHSEQQQRSGPHEAWWFCDVGQTPAE